MLHAAAPTLRQLDLRCALPLHVGTLLPDHVQQRMTALTRLELVGEAGIAGERHKGGVVWVGWARGLQHPAAELSWEAAVDRATRWCTPHAFHGRAGCPLLFKDSRLMLGVWPVRPAEAGHVLPPRSRQAGPADRPAAALPG